MNRKASKAETNWRKVKAARYSRVLRGQADQAVLVDACPGRQVLGGDLVSFVHEDLERAPDDLRVLKEVVDRVKLAVRALGNRPQVVRNRHRLAPSRGGVEQTLDPV